TRWNETHFNRVVVGLHHLNLLERDKVPETADRHVGIDDAAVFQRESIAVAAEHARQCRQTHRAFYRGRTCDGIVADFVANEGHRVVVERRHDDTAGLARRRRRAIITQDFDKHRFGAEVVPATDRTLTGNEANFLRTVLVERIDAEDPATGLPDLI